MKPVLKHFINLNRIMVLVLVLPFTTVFSQDELVELPVEFKIKIESNKTSIKLICIQGCNWKELHFRTSNVNILQAVNSFGMFDLMQREMLPAEESNTFLFTIETSPNSIRLKGIDGTAWKELSFDCFELRCICEIDSYGIARYFQ